MTYPYHVVIVNGKVPKARVVRHDLHCQAGKNGPPNMYSIDEIQQGWGHGPNVNNGVLDLTAQERAALPNRDCACARHELPSAAPLQNRDDLEGPASHPRTRPRRPCDLHAHQRRDGEPHLPAPRAPRGRLRPLCEDPVTAMAAKQDIRVMTVGEGRYLKAYLQLRAGWIAQPPAISQYTTPEKAVMLRSFADARVGQLTSRAKSELPEDRRERLERHLGRHPNDWQAQKALVELSNL
jgi:hypothetical protein